MKGTGTGYAAANESVGEGYARRLEHLEGVGQVEEEIEPFEPSMRIEFAFHNYAHLQRRKFLRKEELHKSALWGVADLLVAKGVSAAPTSQSRYAYFVLSDGLESFKTPSEIKGMMEGIFDVLDIDYK